MCNQSPRLYIFGDSYASEEQLVDWSWYRILSNKLNYKLVNFGFGGSSLEYMFHKFEKNRDKINHDDIVIICLTSLDRTYFFPEIPNLVLENSLKVSCSPNQLLKVNHDKLTALKYYITYFGEIHAEKMQFHLNNFLHSVDNLSEKLGNKIIIINTCLYYDLDKTRFKNLIMPNGLLFDVSAQEYINLELLEKSYTTVDGRINHLSKPNHEILANKIIDYYVNRVIPSLENGFKMNIVHDLKYVECYDK